MAKSSAPVLERKQPEAFCWSLGMRKVTFGVVVVAGNAQVGEEAQDLVAALA